MNIYLEYLIDLYPNSIIYCTHDFLGGIKQQPNGFMPNNWDGSRVYVLGHYNDTDNPPKVFIKN